MKYEIWQWIILVFFLIPLSIEDIKKNEICVWFISVGLLTGILLSALLNGLPFGPGYFAQFLPGIAILITACLTKGCIGKGDGMVCLFLGSILPFSFVVSSLILGFVIAAVYGLILIVMKRAKRKTQLPFIPFLFMGVIICGL